MSALLLSLLAAAAFATLLLWLQGRWVRSRVPLLPEAHGERGGRTAARPAKLSLLIAGDSAAAGVGASSQSEALLGRLLDALQDRFEVHYRLEARTGWKTSEVLAHLQELEPFQVDSAVLSIGVNDVTGGRSRRRFERELEQLRQLLRDRFACRQILFSALPPVHRFPALPQPLRGLLGLRALTFSATLERFCQRSESCVFVSAAASYRDLPGETMASDGFHPGPEIYRVWALALAEKIDSEKMAGEPRSSRGGTAAVV